jgi:sugar-specific transcriptional regulator TrmB
MDLRRLGFTPTESKVYLSLLSLSPATGYAVAQQAGLARANTYDALEGLAARGAVTRLPGRPVRFAAVEPDVLIGRTRRELAQDLDSLARDLSAIEPSRRRAAAQAIEPLAGRAALLDRAVECARGAREELLAVVGPWVSDAYRDLEAARGRRIATRLLSLGTPAPVGAVVRAVPPGEIEAYWGGLPIALVADRRRAVCGVVGRSESASGISTEHPGVIPFLRHLLRRELASATPQRVS